VAFPEPEIGLVICYSYLWADEAAAGRAEGRKSRPCAIVVVVQQADDLAPRVVVTPITHVPPRDPAGAVEIPPSVKRHLGLDDDRSWVVVDDVNVFRWPGFDLRPLPGTRDRYAYGVVPPRFFELIKARMMARWRELSQTSRD
jgi:mRNA-degrading endonuclease toxin of MazEF toxin-antitoxin module